MSFLKGQNLFFKTCDWVWMCSSEETRVKLGNSLISHQPIIIVRRSGQGRSSETRLEALDADAQLLVDADDARGVAVLVHVVDGAEHGDQVVAALDQVAVHLHLVCAHDQVDVEHAAEQVHLRGAALSTQRQQGSALLDPPRRARTSWSRASWAPSPWCPPRDWGRSRAGRRACCGRGSAWGAWRVAAGQSASAAGWCRRARRKCASIWVPRSACSWTCPGTPAKSARRCSVQWFPSRSHKIGWFLKLTALHSTYPSQGYFCIWSRWLWHACNVSSTTVSEPSNK